MVYSILNIAFVVLMKLSVAPDKAKWETFYKAQFETPAIAGECS